MSEEERMKGLSRRDFMKGTGAGIAAAAAAAGSGLINVQPATAQEGPGVVDAELAAQQKWSFEIAPDPIPDSEIADTIEADLIIVGAGVSGLTAANAAAEQGASVVLFAASSAPVFRGGSFHAVNSRYMKENGIEPYDVDTVFRHELAANSFNVDQTKWWKAYAVSEESVDWLSDKMEAAGYQTIIELGTQDPPMGPMHTPYASHGWAMPDRLMGGLSAQAVVTRLAETALEAGVTIHYDTIAKQLVREDDNTGRVTAIIAETKDGTYTKYVGRKAIILATGDFSTDKDMMTKYCPIALPLLNDAGDQGYNNGFKTGGLYPGDGQKMGLWIGAAWQRTYPCAPMLQGSFTASTEPYGAHRGLVVNLKGERFSTEDVNGPFAAHAALHEPEMKTFAIFADNYAEAAAPWYPFGKIYGDDPVPPEQVRAGWESSVDYGQMVKGDTVEEVIEQLGLPVETTKATIERYNSFCETGEDLDFHKQAKHLIPITEGPFYGAYLGTPQFLTVLGGLRTNSDMQVCDADDQPIPGLYNLGSMVGDMYANMYTFRLQGVNLGLNCLTMGYKTGRDLGNGTLA